MAQIQRVKVFLATMHDYFSIDLLARTLFSPYRQISAGKVTGPIGVQVRAMLDNFISRIIGFVVRMLIMIFGVIFMMVFVVGATSWVLLWAVLPVIPIFGFITTAVGFTVSI